MLAHRRGDTAEAMHASPPPLRPSGAPDRPLLDEEVLRLFARAMRIRAWAAPLIAVLATFVALLDPVPWRVATMVTVATIAVVGATLTARWAGRDGVRPHQIRANLAVMWLLQFTMITSSGGLDSPLVPVLVPLAFVTGLLERDPRVVAALLGAQLVLLGALTAGQASGAAPGLLLPALSGGTARPGITLWLEALVLGLVMAAGTMIGRLARDTVERVVRQALHARADQLRAWETHSRDLQHLGAEIAHELKNPLASIKGLAALLVRDAPTGRPAERLGVLRSEVDRMQAILEEFLTFSRPLAPLSLGPVDLMDLAREVGDLHEAVALARHVQVRVEGDGDVQVHADARKVQQVLVNLVQNALDASPEGATVRVAVRATGDLATVEVHDAGAGIPADLGVRVFEAGVTGKPDGSGLGLPVALAIARQHGGRLDLLDAPHGGTVARLVLPLGGPMTEVAA